MARDEIIRFRLSSTEKEALERIAKEQDRSLSSLIRLQLQPLLKKDYLKKERL